MGIEIFEITFQIEKRFGIKFQKGEHAAAFYDTAGTLYEFVWQKLQGVEPAIPDLPRLYREVWKTLNSAPGHHCWYFGARTERFLGSRELNANWGWLEQSLGLKLPELVRDSASGRIHVPKECETSHRLATWIAKTYPDRVDYLRPVGTTGRPAGWERFTREDCWLGVRDVLAETLCVEPEDVVPEAHLICDLGMD